MPIQFGEPLPMDAGRTPILLNMDREDREDHAGEGMGERNLFSDMNYLINDNRDDDDDENMMGAGISPQKGKGRSRLILDDGEDDFQ